MTVEKDIYSFIVRIWRDSSNSQSPEAGWRGSIDDVSSGKRLYFQDLESVDQFIQEQTGAVFKPASMWWTRLKRKLHYR
jgi:hypothetical protein